MDGGLIGRWSALIQLRGLPITPLKEEEKKKGCCVTTPNRKGEKFPKILVRILKIEGAERESKNFWRGQKSNFWRGKNHLSIAASDYIFLRAKIIEFRSKNCSRSFQVL